MHDHGLLVEQLAQRHSLAAPIARGRILAGHHRHLGQPGVGPSHVGVGGDRLEHLDRPSGDLAGAFGFAVPPQVLGQVAQGAALGADIAGSRPGGNGLFLGGDGPLDVAGQVALVSVRGEEGGLIWLRQPGRVPQGTLVVNQRGAVGAQGRGVGSRLGRQFEHGVGVTSLDGVAGQLPGLGMGGVLAQGGECPLVKP